MNIFIGKNAPDFTAKAIMPDNSIEENFNLKTYIHKSKCVIFFYPLNFTFVCPSEIIAFNKRLDQFKERNTKLIAVSVDSHFCHLAWKNTPVEKGGIGQVQFPMVSDLNKEISNMYNVLHEGGMALRGTILIDEDFNIRHMLINDLPLGRNVDETLRTIDALEFHQQHGEVCPAGWHKGRSGMKATSKGVAEYLSEYESEL